jgi:hypothetical protein
MEELIGTIDINLFGTMYSGVQMRRANYQSGGGQAVTLWHEEEPFGTLTTNIDGAPLEPGEFCVKTWSENEPVWPVALASGHFVDTGKRVPTGFVEAQVWRFA